MRYVWAQQMARKNGAPQPVGRITIGRSLANWRKISEAYNEQGDPFWINYAQRSLLVFDCTAECAAELAPEIHQYLRDFHHSEDYVPPDVPEVLGQLKGSGYRLGVLSNRSQPYREYLKELGLADYFDMILAAGEVNLWKPDPGIFQLGLERMQADAARSVYVGDNYFADIVGAQNAGLLPVLIDPDGVFTEADCPVIKTFSELPGLLQED